MVWFFLALAALSVALGFERMWRMRNQPATLSHVAYLVVLFAMGYLSGAYATMPLTAGFFNFGLGSWHVMLGILIGGVEVMMLTLRKEEPKRSQVKRIVWRSGLITLVLLVTWLLGFAQAGPMYNISVSAPRNTATLIHLVVFPLYIVWGLAQIIRICFQRIAKDIFRRPISTVALVMVSLGAGGFIWVNVVVCFNMLADLDFSTDEVYLLTPLFLGLCVAGAGLLASGERAYEELYSRYHLRRLNPLWDRVVELLPDGLHLADCDLSSSARLQRAYVEISDAICTLRVVDSRPLDVATVAVMLREGEVSADVEAPTISQVLPVRRTRREDLDLIHALADMYPRPQRGSMDASVAA